MGLCTNSTKFINTYVAFTFGRRPWNQGSGIGHDVLESSILILIAGGIAEIGSYLF